MNDRRPTSLATLLARHAVVLMEAAIVERLRRGDHGVRLDPLLVHAPLVYQPAGLRALAQLYGEYVSAAERAGLPILLGTPTWRANRERVAAAGLTTNVNADAAAFLHDLRASRASWKRILIGGLIGCKNDCYRPAESLTAEGAESFHVWQVEQLAAAGVDYLMAATLPALPEAIGIARAMSSTGVPYIISFVIDRSGVLLDGTDLPRAFAEVDAASDRAPIGFMVNCAYPSFLQPGGWPPSARSRLIGFQANASALDHDQLDGSEMLHAEEVGDWASRMVELHRRFGVKILGGCCGTHRGHLESLADLLRD